MSGKRLSEEKILNYRDALTLPLRSEASPFDLGEDEHNFGPDDWAWLFLSLNQDYRNVYNEHTNAPDVDLSTRLVAPQIPDIKPDHSKECAGQFGLATWISPSTIRLPQLSEKSDSWFFPLKILLGESAQHQRSPGPKNHTSILTNQDLFGYRPPTPQEGRA